MTARRLLWELLKHMLHRRGRDAVYVGVYLDLPGVEPVFGEAKSFTWEGDADAFCTIVADVA